MRTFFTALSVLIAGAIGAFSNPAAAQLNQGTAGIAYGDLFPGARFDPALPDLEAFAGLLPGQRPLTGEEVSAYFRRLAELSGRAVLREYGASHQGRPLFYLAIGEEATLKDLESFRDKHRRLLDPREGGVPSLERLEGTKAVVWLAFCIHGGELSGTDAAAALAYRLVAGEDDEARRLRAKLIVLIDPLQNPDGRARYLAQITSFAHRRANPDPDDLSHAGVWPWGRGNHYLFDLNRDWFRLVQPESRRVAAITGWLPQLLVDSHEMGPQSTYLFSPPRHPFNPHMPPNTRFWEQIFSQDQGRALDARGYPYYSGEWNEEFFPGYGSAWGTYMGAVGILHEMSRTSGTLVRRRDSSVRTFAQAVEHQAVSALANLTTLADNAPQVLHDMIAARDLAVREGRDGPVRAWLFPADERWQTRLERFADTLVQQGIEVQTLVDHGLELAGLRAIVSGNPVDRTVPKGSLLIRLDQPQARLARVLLDPHVPMETTFLREERMFLEKDRGSRLYDTTAWSVPLTLGVEAYWLERQPAGSWEAWRPLKATPPVALQGPFVAVIVSGQDDASPAVLARLLQEGLTVRVARKPFAVRGGAFAPGALLLRQEGNPPDLEQRLRALQHEFDLALIPVETSRAEAGPDLGGTEFRELIAPRIGLFTGSPIAPGGYGFLWHLLDQKLDLRFNALDIGRFRRIDLARYNVLVFPPAQGGAAIYRELLGSEGLARLKQWVEAGGTAIGIGSGARLLADPGLELTRARFRADVLERFPPPVWSIAAEEARAAGKPVATGLRLSPKEPESVPVVGHGFPYDVAPLLGPGALPFSVGHDQGRPLAARPLSAEQWLAPLLGPGRGGLGRAALEEVDRRLRRFMPQGALLTLELDPEHWLNFGLSACATVWFGQDDTLIAVPPVDVTARFPEPERMHRGGLLWPEAAARMAHTAYATREAIGRGQVILFADHPAHRRWMAETERMLANALLLGPGLGTRWSAPW